MTSAIARPGLAFLLLAACVSEAGAQQAAGGALPSVVYPMHDPDTVPIDNGPPLRPAAAALPVVQGPPAQYVLYGGVWGYWDRYRRFHPRPVSIVRDPDDRRGAHPPGTVWPEPFAPVRRYATRLPNPPPRAIVAAPSSPHGHPAGH